MTIPFEGTFVFSYDGENWRPISAPSAAFLLRQHDDPIEMLGASLAPTGWAEGIDTDGVPVFVQCTSGKA